MRFLLTLANRVPKNQALQLGTDTEQVLYIHDLAVHPEWHRTGSNLVKHLVIYAQQENF